MDGAGEGGRGAGGGGGYGGGGSVAQAVGASSRTSSSNSGANGGIAASPADYGGEDSDLTSPLVVLAGECDGRKKENRQERQGEFHMDQRTPN